MPNPIPTLLMSSAGIAAALVARGKAKPKVATAIARELTGFIWAIAREVPAPPA